MARLDKNSNPPSPTSSSTSSTGRIFKNDPKTRPPELSFKDKLIQAREENKDNPDAAVKAMQSVLEKETKKIKANKKHQEDYIVKADLTRANNEFKAQAGHIQYHAGPRSGPEELTIADVKRLALAQFDEFIQLDLPQCVMNRITQIDPTKTQPVYQPLYQHQLNISSLPSVTSLQKEYEGIVNNNLQILKTAPNLKTEKDKVLAQCQNRIEEWKDEIAKGIGRSVGILGDVERACHQSLNETKHSTPQRRR